MRKLTGRVTSPTDTRFAALVRSRAKRLGIRPEELVGLVEGIRDLPADLEERARETGLSIPQILELEWKDLREFNSPDSPCLNPDELERYVTRDELAPDRKAHLGGCALCQAVVSAARVDPATAEQMGRRLAQGGEPAGREKSAGWLPESPSGGEEDRASTEEDEVEENAGVLVGTASRSSAWRNGGWRSGWLPVGLSGAVLVAALLIFYPQLPESTWNQITLLRNAPAEINRANTRIEQLAGEKERLQADELATRCQLQEKEKEVAKLRDLAEQNDWSVTLEGTLASEKVLFPRGEKQRVVIQVKGRRDMVLRLDDAGSKETYTEVQRGPRQGKVSGKVRIDDDGKMRIAVEKVQFIK
jgi:hypothetical protein